MISSDIYYKKYLKYKYKYLNFKQGGNSTKSNILHNCPDNAINIETSPHIYNKYDMKDFQIRYINLNKSKFRKKQMVEQFNKEKIDANRFNAINGKTLNLNNYHKYLFNKKQNIHTNYSRNMKKYFLENPNMIGHFGCYLSHIYILQEFIKSDKKYLLVFEDDVILSKKFKNKLLKRMQYIPNNWDIILPGFITAHTWKEKYIHNNNLKIKNGYLPLKCFNGTYSVLYNKKSAKKILKLLIPMDWIIDWNLSFIAIDNPNIHIYGMVNPLVHTPGNWEIKNNLFKYNYNINYNDKWISTTNI